MNIKIIPDCVKDRLQYDKNTGLFVWAYKNKMHPRLHGKKAGTIREGYLVIKINGSAFRGHRIAWFIMTGEQPEMIDHINGNKSDNRFSNLRACSYLQNTQNHSRKYNGSGLPVGVRKMKGIYVARITANKVVHYLGTFRSINEASKAYSDARSILHDAPCTKDAL